MSTGGHILMSAGNYTIAIDQGADFTLQLTIKDATGTEVDLTGHTFRGQIRKSISNAVIVASFSFTLLDQVTSPGRVDVTMSNAVSSAILLPKQDKVQRKAEKMAYDIESEDGLGIVVRWLEGAVDFSPEVTR